MVSDETAYRKYLAGDEAAAQLLVERYGDALTLTSTACWAISTRQRI